jgi:hypothetical protein
MHCYQNKHGRLVALLVLFTDTGAYCLKKTTNQLFKVVCGRG